MCQPSTSVGIFHTLVCIRDGEGQLYIFHPRMCCQGTFVQKGLKSLSGYEVAYIKLGSRNEGVFLLKFNGSPLQDKTANLK